MDNKAPRADLHQRLLDHFVFKGTALYMLVTWFLAITIDGLAAYLLNQPLLLPSLSTTVFAYFRRLRMRRRASPRRPCRPTGCPGRHVKGRLSMSERTAGGLAAPGRQPVDDLWVADVSTMLEDPENADAKRVPVEGHERWQPGLRPAKESKERRC